VCSACLPIRFRQAALLDRAALIASFEEASARDAVALAAALVALEAAQQRSQQGQRIAEAALVQATQAAKAQQRTALKCLVAVAVAIAGSAAAVAAACHVALAWTGATRRAAPVAAPSSTHAAPSSTHAAPEAWRPLVVRHVDARPLLLDRAPAPLPACLTLPTALAGLNRTVSTAEGSEEEAELVELYWRWLEPLAPLPLWPVALLALPAPPANPAAASLKEEAAEVAAPSMVVEEEEEEEPTIGEWLVQDESSDYFSEAGPEMLINFSSNVQPKPLSAPFSAAPLGRHVSPHAPTSGLAAPALFWSPQSRRDRSAWTHRSARAPLAAPP
jgi:hypothetical protein